MKKVLLGFLVFVVFVSQAQVKTQKVQASDNYSASNGIVYALPKVVIRLDVWIEKTDHIKGPYSTYASRLLGLSNVIESNTQSYVLKSVDISTTAIPDADQMYFIDLGDMTGKSDNPRFIQMSESGLFGGLGLANEESSQSSQQRPIEIVVKGDRDFHYYADANLVDKIDTIIRRVDVDTATIEKATIKRTSIEKNTSQRAQDAATYYMEIRKNRMELISGFQEVAYSPGTLGLMNAELKQMEDDYLALFAGKTQLTDEHYVFYYTPSSEQANIIAPIFKFSPQTGFNYISSGTGEKVSIAIKSSGLSESISDVDVSGVIDGIVYRFPETAEVWVKYGAKTFDNQMMVIPQLGRLQSIQIGQNIFQLHSATGGLKVLEYKK